MVRLLRNLGADINMVKALFFLVDGALGLKLPLSDCRKVPGMSDSITKMIL